MSAWSFAPAKGAPKGGYALGLLLKARDAIAELDQKQRGALDEIVFTARKTRSWPAKLDDDDHDIQQAYALIRAAAHRD